MSLLNTLWIRRNLAIGVFLLVSLCGALATALIPLRYSAQATIALSHHTDATLKSENQVVAELNDRETQILISDDILIPTIKKWNLIERSEFNIAYDKNRALTSRTMDYIEEQIDDEGASRPLIETIKKQIRKELTVNFTYDTLTLEYTSVSPHIARSLTNTIAELYINTPNPHLKKELVEKATVPKTFSTPDLKSALYCIAITGFILSLFCVYFIKPRDKHTA